MSFFELLRRRANSRRVPGDLLLEPLVLACALLLGLNDHYLKAQYHNAITGKISDFSGLVVFPCVLLSLFEWMRWSGFGTGSRIGVPSRQKPQSLLGSVTESWQVRRVHAYLAVLLSGAVFSAIQLFPGADRAYEWVLSHVYFCIGDIWFELGMPQNSPDPMDLMALVVLPIPVWLVARRERYAPETIVFARGLRYRRSRARRAST